VDAVERCGLCDRRLGRRGNKSSPPSMRLVRRLRHSWKKFQLTRRFGCVLNAISETSGTGFAEQLTGAVADGPQADDTFVNINDPVLPSIQMNAKRLRKPARYVINQCKPLGLSAASFFFFFFLLICLFGYRLFALGGGLVRAVAGCRPDRPQEQCCKPCVLFKCTGTAIPRLSFSGAEDLA